MMLPEDGDGSQMAPMALRDWANPVDDCDPRRRRRCIITSASVASVILLIIISVLASGSRRSSPYQTVNDDNKEVYTLVKSLYIGHELPYDDLLLTSGYQNQAFNWLASTPNLDEYAHEQKIQRFALACFYYATNKVSTEYIQKPRHWNDDSLWLSEEHECEWRGITCTTEGKIQSISLEHNDLSGRLPMELAMIWDDLKVLELSFNDITMADDDWDIFLRFKNLEKLALSANHVVSSTGVPSQLLRCSHLRNLLLSSNELSGPLKNGVLEGMKKLTHLEIEFNDLTGHLSGLEDLHRLEQVYLRHNELHGHLGFLKSGKLSNLLAVWLDGNDVVSTIPPEIGKLTYLQSVSISDTNLSGTIPSEIGLLDDLQRLWLYKNKLTGTVPSEIENLSNLEVLKLEHNDLEGTIPSQVCKNIDHATFAKSALAADCDKVECECCTECF